MDANLDKVAKDLYGKIQTRFRDIRMGDENANVLSKKEDIPKARFFEFEYEEGGEPLGTIAITLDPQDGIVLQVSGDLVNDDDHTSHHGAYKFIRGFRQFAKDRLLNFDVQNIGKSNLDKRDYEFQSKRKEEPVMPAIMENKLYGNARMSYQDLGEARLVIKHSQPINAELPAGRTMHIESIYIENALGERFKYPAKHINGARALAEHIKHGGNPYDSIGKYITGLSEELTSLRKFKGYVSRQDQLSEAMSSVTSRVMERIEEIKKQVQNLQRSSYYESFVESFEAQEEQIVPEAIANDLIDRLTIRTFNEELKSVFPYIYKFIDESELPVVELGVDDILGERQPISVAPQQASSQQDLGDGFTLTTVDVAGAQQPAVFDSQSNTHFTLNRRSDGSAIFRTPAAYLAISNGKVQPVAKLGPATTAAMTKAGLVTSTAPAQPTAPAQQTPEDQFESFVNDIIREDKDEIFSPNKDARRAAIDKLNKLMAQELKGGPEGTNAIMSLKGLIDDPEFVNSLRDVDPDLDVRPLVQQHIQSIDPDVASQIKFGGTEDKMDEPEAPASEPATAEVPPAPEPATAEVPPAPEAGLPQNPPPPAPVAEGLDDPDDNPCWKGYHPVGTKKKNGKTVPNCVPKNEGIANLIINAKEAGATLETQLDFGSRTMTLGEIIESCGMRPSDFGYDDQENSIAGHGLPGMLKYISGFYNREKGNFPLGGMRIKIKVKKAFEDGEFGDASPEDLMKVLKFIDMKDPSGNEHNQIMRLAGVEKTAHESSFDITGLEDQLNELVLQFNENNGLGQNASIVSPNAQLQPAQPDAVTPADSSAAAPAAEPVPAAAPASKNRDAMTFGQAFADARKAGEKVFTWKGKKYGTQLAQSGQAAKPAQPAAPQSAYADPDVSGQGAQNAAWLNQKFPQAQPGQEYWVKGTRYEKRSDGWYRTFEKGEIVSLPINRLAHQYGYTGPSDSASMQAWGAKIKQAQAQAQPKPATQTAKPNLSDLDMAESKESGYDELKSLLNIVHYR